MDPPSPPCTHPCCPHMRSSPQGRSATLTAFHTLSHISEGLIFIFLGLDTLDPNKWHMAHAGER